MYDKVIQLDFCTIVYSQTDKSVYWNLALTNQKLSPSQLSKIEDTLISLKRTPVIYFEDTKRMCTLGEFLKKNGYKKEFADCFLFYQKKTVDQTHFKEIKKVETEKDLEIFLETENKCYQKDDPQNPYGELGDYLELARKFWFRHHKTNRVEFYTAFKNGAPVSVGILTNYDDIGYLACIGSKKEVRGQGYGKAISLYMIQQSINHRNKYHCLATEEGHYPYEFYQRIGFKPIFTAVGYARKNN